MILFEPLNSNWALAYSILEWVLRLAFIALILPNREPTAARIWLLFGFLAPLPAAIAYALIGRVGVPRVRRQREERATEIRWAWLELRRPRRSRSASNLATYVEGIGGNPPTQGNRIALMADYEETIDALVDAIAAARSRVRILAYIFADDRVGDRVIGALAQARARGVATHVMLDALGSRQWRASVQRKLTAAGVDVRVCNVYNPIRGGTGRLDRRNHRKIYVIDDAVAFMGSQNIVARDFRRGIVNYELMLRIEGPIVADLGAQFVIDWRGDGGQLLGWPLTGEEPAGNVHAQILATGPDRMAGAYTLLLSRLLQEALQSVLIASPYLVLDEGMRLAIVTAAMRGVQVTLLLSAVVDQPVVRLAQEAGYAALLKAGVEIRHFVPGLLHAKYVVVDGARAIIGTSNADIRSFQINAEVSLVSEDSSLLADLTQVARAHLAQSSALTVDQWQQRPGHRRVLQRIAALASPLL